MVTVPLLLLITFLAWQATRQDEGWAEGATRPAALTGVVVVGALLAGRDALFMVAAGALLGAATQREGWRRGALGALGLLLAGAIVTFRVMAQVRGGLLPL